MYFDIISTGFPKLGACIGMAVFTHSWYWYPLAHFINLSFAPSAIIGVDSEFRIPRSFDFKCKSKVGQFDYIPQIKKDDDKKDLKTSKVELSKTKKFQARLKAKDNKDDGGDQPLN